MSIAWATVVLVVLLLPGFCFLWGFYLPHQVTRESVPVNPLTQLAGVVIYGFFFHGTAFWAANSLIDGEQCAPNVAVVRCLDFDQLAAIVRIDGAPSPGKAIPQLNESLTKTSGPILLYFVVAGALSLGIGYFAGTLVSKGVLPLNRHRYLFTLEQARKVADSDSPTALLVRAYVLSKTANNGLVVLYEGLVQDFFARADGTINYLVLRGPSSSTLEIKSGSAQPAGASAALGKATADTSQAFLVITSEDIANVYFEPTTLVQSQQGTKTLDDALAKDEQAAAQAG